MKQNSDQLVVLLSFGKREIGSFHFYVQCISKIKNIDRLLVNSISNLILVVDFSSNWLILSNYRAYVCIIKLLCLVS